MTSFAARSARCRISGIRGSSPLEVGTGSFWLVGVEEDVDVEVDGEDAHGEDEDEDDDDGRTMLSTASSTHSRMRFLRITLSGEPARRLLSVQLFARPSTCASGAFNSLELLLSAGSCGGRGSVARLVTWRTTSPMSDRHLRISASRSRSLRSCLLDDRLLLPLLL